MASSPCDDCSARPLAARQRILAVALVPELLLHLAPLDLMAQFFGDLQPSRFQSMVARVGVDVRARHGQMHLRAEGGRAVPTPFQHHIGRGDGDELVQAFELLLQPTGRLALALRP